MADNKNENPTKNESHIKESEEPLLSKKSSYRNRFLAKYDNPRDHKLVSYWGPAGIAIGVSCILNSLSITSKSINYQSSIGITTLIAGIIILILGTIMTYVMYALLKYKETLARLGLTVGMSIFFWGTRVANTYQANYGLLIGWVLIILGIIFIYGGFIWSPLE